MNDIKLLCPPQAVLLLAAPQKSPYGEIFVFKTLQNPVLLT